MVQPFPFVPVTVYVVVVGGLAVTVAPVVEDNPVAGVHVYVVAPFAVNETLVPAHIAEGDAGLTFIVGTGETVIVVLAELEHPLPFVTVYTIVEGPADTPVTTPLPLIVAIAGLVLDHTPPGVASDKLMVLPTHTLEGPVIADTVGTEFTVTTT